MHVKPCGAGSVPHVVHDPTSAGLRRSTQAPSIHRARPPRHCVIHRSARHRRRPLHQSTATEIGGYAGP